VPPCGPWWASPSETRCSGGDWRGTDFRGTWPSDRLSYRIAEAVDGGDEGRPYRTSETKMPMYADSEKLNDTRSPLAETVRRPPTKIGKNGDSVLSVENQETL